MKAGLLALLLLGCGGPRAATPLPDALGLVVQLKDGELASALVEMKREEREIRVHTTPGVVALGPGWAAAVRLDATARGVALSREDLLTGAVQGVAAPEGVTLVELNASQTLLKVGDVALRWEDGGPLRPVPRWRAAAPPAAPGPGDGFRLRLNQGRVELRRPRGAGEWTPVLQEVEGLVGAWWLHLGSLPAEERALIAARLRETDHVEPVAGDAVVDGDLAEWAREAAVAVDQPGHVIAGAEGWRGPRDGAFGVAARWSAGTLYLAIRVRDDARVEGEDRIEVQWDDRRAEVPLSAGPGRAGGLGWQAALSDPDWLGQRLELQLDAPAPSHVVVQLLDADPGEPTTRLGTAAWPRMAALVVPPDPVE